MFQEVFSRTTFAANIPVSHISEAAVQLEGFVVNCHYAGHRCNKERDFLRFWDPYYFNCFTYRAPEQTEIDDSLSEGIENGWSAILLSGSGMLDKNDEIRMLPGLHEWRSAVSSSEGVRVVIHPPKRSRTHSRKDTMCLLDSPPRLELSQEGIYESDHRMGIVVTAIHLPRQQNKLRDTGKWEK